MSTGAGLENGGRGVPPHQRVCSLRVPPGRIDLASGNLYVCQRIRRAPTHRWRGGRVAEGGGLLNRYTAKPVSWVRIPSPPPPSPFCSRRYNIIFRSPAAIFRPSNRYRCAGVCAVPRLATTCSSGVKKARYSSVVLI